MFVILVTYKKPLDVVDKYLALHREYLDKCYSNNFFLVSGPRNPRTGGVIISQLSDYDQLIDVLNHDPFNIHGVADYEIINFTPTKNHVDFAAFI